MLLSAFLESQGYKRISLTRNGLGHLETTGILAGHAVRVLIDTGAGATIVALPIAQDLGLELISEGHTGGGAGGTNLETFKVKNNVSLTLDNAVPRPKALIAMDLSHVNAALGLKGASAVDVILGVDVFERQAAVIDYGTSSRFLRDAEGVEDKSDVQESSGEALLERSST